MLKLITLIDCVGLGVLYWLFFHRQFRHTDTKTLFTRTLFYLYICVVIYFTLLPLIPTFDAPNYNQIPFRDVIYAFGDYDRQIMYNILLFMPFGFLLPCVFPNLRKEVILAGFLCSLCIEISQPWITINRVCDITDLITNTSGTCLGYILFLMFKKDVQK